MALPALVALGVTLAPGAAWAHQTFTVAPGESIQAAVDRASPGDTVVVLPGTYEQNVSIATDRITLEGFGATLRPPTAPAPDCFGDPDSGRVFGICVVGQFDAGFNLVHTVNRVQVLGFTVQGFSASGVAVFGGRRTTVSRITAKRDGGYGILSEFSTRSLIAANSTTRNHEAGIYVGESPHDAATVVDNQSDHDGLLGIFVRESSGGTAIRNTTTDSCIGIGLLDIPNETSASLAQAMPAVLAAASPEPPLVANWDVSLNEVTDNTGFCHDEPPESGTGILFTGTRKTRIHDNVVLRNLAPPGVVSPLAGGIVAGPAGTFGSRPSSGVTVGHNVVLDNAPYDLARLPGSGSGIRFVGNVCGTSLPAGLC